MLTDELLSERPHELRGERGNAVVGLLDQLLEARLRKNRGRKSETREGHLEGRGGMLCRSPILGRAWGRIPLLYDKTRMSSRLPSRRMALPLLKYSIYCYD